MLSSLVAGRALLPETSGNTLGQSGRRASRDFLDRLSRSARFTVAPRTDGGGLFSRAPLS